MKIIFQKLIAMSPILIIGFTIVILMLSISLKRNNLINFIITLFGFVTSLLSIFLLGINNYLVNISLLVKIDKFALFCSSLIIISAIASSIFGYYWLKNLGDNYYKDEFYLLITIIVLGGVLLSISDHMISMFVGIELITLPLFGLISYDYKTNYSLEAGIKYILLSVSFSFLLFGIAFLYAESGDLSFVSIANFFSDKQIHKPLVIIGLGMLIVGFCFKLSLFPFHLWTPDIYQGSPIAVSSFLSTGNKIAVFSVLFRIFAKTSISDTENIDILFSIIAVTSIIFGNLLALIQKNIKRLLGYSSVTNIGYLLVALILSRNDLIISKYFIIIYLISYVFSNLGIFGVINTISNSFKTKNFDNMREFRGLFYNNPILAVIMNIMIFSLAGVPMTLGFIAKFYLIISVMYSKIFYLISIIVIGNIIGIYYYLRFVASFYVYEKKDIKMNLNFKKELLSIFFITVCTFIIIIFGIWPQFIIDIASMIINN
ncbi:NADH-quinone oxidoreductase subunit N [Candidatus Providencia siddallii]|uniref:NADH-quinone oxidoreductase subunit N n=1 Tax=Candidatus Providencia siddallii TaxID=1715285 RepID=A0ABM9NNP2_9GAMM